MTRFSSRHTGHDSASSQATWMHSWVRNKLHVHMAIDHQQVFMENCMNQGSFQYKGKRNAAKTGLSTK